MINSGTNIKTDEINDAVAAVGRRMPKPDKPKFDFAIFEHEGCGTKAARNTKQVIVVKTQENDKKSDASWEERVLDPILEFLSERPKLPVCILVEILYTKKDGRETDSVMLIKYGPNNSAIADRFVYASWSNAFKDTHNVQRSMSVDSISELTFDAIVEELNR